MKSLERGTSASLEMPSNSTLGIWSPTCFERDNKPLEEVGLVVVTSVGALRNKDRDIVPLKNGCFVEVGGLFPS